MATATSQAAEWVNASEARALVGLRASRQLRRLVRRGYVATREVPGTRPLYHRGDLERIAAESVRPATTSGAHT
jgi:hypothetical protein